MNKLGAMKNPREPIFEKYSSFSTMRVFPVQRQFELNVFPGSLRATLDEKFQNNYCSE